MLYDLSDVSHDYRLGDVITPALRKITLQIESGEFVALSGPSGSGKTTLGNLMGVLDSPHSGKNLFDGVDVSLTTDHQRTTLRKERIGFVFQRFHLIPVLTAYENVEYFLRRKHTAEEARERVKAALELVGVSAQANQRPHAMSGGQMQRVAIARALVKEPSVVLADEPTAALDHKTGEAVLALMKKLNRERKTTFIFSTHDPKVLAAADRIITMEDGALQ